MRIWMRMRVYMRMMGVGVHVHMGSRRGCGRAASRPALHQPLRRAEAARPWAAAVSAAATDDVFQATAGVAESGMSYTVAAGCAIVPSGAGRGVG